MSASAPLVSNCAKDASVCEAVHRKDTLRALSAEMVKHLFDFERHSLGISVR